MKAATTVGFLRVSDNLKEYEKGTTYENETILLASSYVIPVANITKGDKSKVDIFLDIKINRVSQKTYDNISIDGLTVSVIATDKPIEKPRGVAKDGSLSPLVYKSMTLVKFSLRSDTLVLKNKPKSNQKVMELYDFYLGDGVVNELSKEGYEDSYAFVCQVGTLSMRVLVSLLCKLSNDYQYLMDMNDHMLIYLGDNSKNLGHMRETCGFRKTDLIRSTPEGWKRIDDGESTSVFRIKLLYRPDYMLIPEKIEAMHPSIAEALLKKWPEYKIHSGVIINGLYIKLNSLQELKDSQTFCVSDTDPTKEVGVIYQSKPTGEGGQIHIKTPVADLLEKCKRKGGTALIPLFLHIDTMEKHMNVLVFDFSKHELERFDPNTATYPHQVEENINVNMAELCENIMGIGSGYISPMDYCPTFGVQQRQSKELYSEGIGGFCSVWSSLYMHLRVLYPLSSRKTVYRYMKHLPTILGKDFDYTKIVSRYANWLGDTFQGSIYKKESVSDPIFDQCTPESLKVPESFTKSLCFININNSHALIPVASALTLPIVGVNKRMPSTIEALHEIKTEGFRNVDSVFFKSIFHVVEFENVQRRVPTAFNMDICESHIKDPSKKEICVSLSAVLHIYNTERGAYEDTTTNGSGVLKALKFLSSTLYPKSLGLKHITCLDTTLTSSPFFDQKRIRARIIKIGNKKHLGLGSTQMNILSRFYRDVFCYLFYLLYSLYYKDNRDSLSQSVVLFKIEPDEEHVWIQALLSSFGCTFIPVVNDQSFSDTAIPEESGIGKNELYAGALVEDIYEKVRCFYSETRFL